MPCQSTSSNRRRLASYARLYSLLAALLSCTAGRSRGAAQGQTAHVSINDGALHVEGLALRCVLRLRVCDRDRLPGVSVAGHAGQGQRARAAELHQRDALLAIGNALAISEREILKLSRARGIGAVRHLYSGLL